MEKSIKKFNEMEVGGTYSTYLLLQAITEKTAKNGKTYVELELCDGNETVIARQFDSSKHDLVCFGIDEESVVFVSIKVDLYNGARNYTITNISGNYEEYITVSDFTEEGRLIGHAAIGIMIIEDWAELSGCSPRRVKLLQHMIAAHHGQQEIGAVVEPAVPEAAVLHAIDMIDSRIYIFNEAYKNMEEGAMSGNIYALGNKTVFKPVPMVPTESQEEDDSDEDFDLFDESAPEYEW